MAKDALVLINWCWDDCKKVEDFILPNVDVKGDVGRIISRCPPCAQEDIWWCWTASAPEGNIDDPTQ